MKTWLTSSHIETILSLLLLVFACWPAHAVLDDKDLDAISAGADQLAKDPHYALPSLSGTSAGRIAANVYNNEANCDPDHLIEWDKGSGENFLSAGVAHTTWKASGITPYTDPSFPEFWSQICGKAKQADIALPKNFQSCTIPDAPWTSPEELAAKAKAKDADLVDLKRFLANPKVMEFQTQYMTGRLDKAVYRILAATKMEHPEKLDKVYANMKTLMASDAGRLALVDYVNFKGEGLLSKKATGMTKELNWGLRQVLEDMDDAKGGLLQKQSDLKGLDNVTLAPKVFAESAYRVLMKRAQAVEDPVRRNKEIGNYLGPDGGWTHRIQDTYANGGIEACPNNASLKLGAPALATQ